jgi:aryl-phospho-beta-D-glucosidase BglC (GH1 family)
MFPREGARLKTRNVRAMRAVQWILRLLGPIALVAVVTVSLHLGWIRPARGVTGLKNWSTRGADILTPAGTPFVIAGISWYGLESPQDVPYGLDSRDYTDILTAVKSYRFNTLRISFSNQVWETDPMPDQELVRACPACQGLDARDLLARIINYAGSIGLHVILDDHRSDAGVGTALNGLWYDTGDGHGYTEHSWIDDWVAVQHWIHGQRMTSGAPDVLSVHDVASDGFPTVIGYDLRNEPHTPVGAPYLQGATWGTGDGIDPHINPNPNPFAPTCVVSSTCHDWRLAAERAGDTILGDAVHHGWPVPLIFVQGVSSYPTASGTAQHGPYDLYRWGGQLEGVNGNDDNPGAPIVLNDGGTAARLGPAAAHQLVYVTRDYGPTVSPTDWFTSTTCYRLGCAPAHTQSGLVDLWCQHWAYINLPPGRYGACTGGVQPHFRAAFPWKNTGSVPYTQAPVWIGEFGTGNTASDLESPLRGSQGQWFTDIVNFIQSSYASDTRNASGIPVHDLSWSYWALDADDSYALLGERYTGLASPPKEYSFLCFIVRAPLPAAPSRPACGSTGRLPGPR